LIWPEGVGGQPWTGDIFADKKLATSAFPVWDNKEGHDFRYQSKAVQHGSNLGLTPYGMAIQKRIPVAAATEGQARYFKAFPGIRTYQRYIRQTVEEQRPIITPLGVRFKLFGRPWEEHTYKEGLAVIPQSMVGHIISIGIWRIWVEMPEIQLLAQVHDAILFQFPKGQYDLVYKALELMSVPIPVHSLDGKDREILISTEAAVGPSWSHKELREITFTSPTEWKLK
jgi:DNA polymerase I-like protein with 3'-5' exonuclease and polymerase domains